MGGGTNLCPIAPESFLDPTTEEGAGSRRKASDYSGLSWADDTVRWWEALALFGILVLIDTMAVLSGGYLLAAAVVPLLAILPLAVYGYTEVIVAIAGNAAFGVLLGFALLRSGQGLPFGSNPGPIGTALLVTGGAALVVVGVLRSWTVARRLVSGD